MSATSKFLDLLLPAPLPPVQKRDAQHKFLQHKRAHNDCGDNGKAHDALEQVILGMWQGNLPKPGAATVGQT